MEENHKDIGVKREDESSMISSSPPKEDTSSPSDSNPIADHVINSRVLKKNWLSGVVSEDPSTTDYSTESDNNETEGSLLSDDTPPSLALNLSSHRKKKMKRDSSHKPTLKDLQLVGDILFTETPTVGYSEEEQSELIALGDVSKLTPQGRSSVFEKGVQFERKGKPGLSLQCYLACIQGLDGEVGNFPELPLCLRHIARLYFAEEDYEKAVHFVQAEKLYYETELLGNELKPPATNVKRSKSEDLKHMMIARAIEFEQLSEMCLENKNIGLALDYIGKAVKINESVYGKDDSRSRQSYEKFSYIYAEAGKIQYNDALLRFQRKQQSHQQLPQTTKEEIASEEPEEIYTPEQSLFQKIFSISLLFIFLIIIIIEITLVILSFSKGYLYIPSSHEINSAVSFLWEQVRGREHPRGEL